MLLLVAGCTASVQPDRPESDPCSAVCVLCVVTVNCLPPGTKEKEDGRT